MDQRSRTHRAGLDRDENLTIQKAMITYSTCRFTQGNNLSVSCRIRLLQIAIASAPNDALFANDHGPNRNLSLRTCTHGFAQSFFHPEFVAWVVG
jgi:hypothetical protein